VSAPLVLASLALVNLMRFLLRPLVLAPARRWGLKPLVIAGTLLCMLQYPLLAEVRDALPDRRRRRMGRGRRARLPQRRSDPLAGRADAARYPPLSSSVGGVVPDAARLLRQGRRVSAVTGVERGLK
jgi:hypothetical protein